MSYCPFDCLLQSAATFWIVPPGWVATNQLRVTGPPVSGASAAGSDNGQARNRCEAKRPNREPEGAYLLLLPWFGLALSYPGQIACKPRAP